MMGGGGTPGAAIGGGLIAGLSQTSNILHSMFQNQRNRNFADTFAKKKFQWAVGDLKKAGINPIYAVSGGIGGGGTVGGMIGPGGAPDIMQSARAGAMMHAEIQRLKAQTRQEHATADRQTNEAADAHFRAQQNWNLAAASDFWKQQASYEADRMKWSAKAAQLAYETTKPYMDRQREFYEKEGMPNLHWYDIGEILRTLGAGGGGSAGWPVLPRGGVKPRRKRR